MDFNLQTDKTRITVSMISIPEKINSGSHMHIHSSNTYIYLNIDQVLILH